MATFLLLIIRKNSALGYWIAKLSTILHRGRAWGCGVVESYFYIFRLSFGFILGFLSSPRVGQSAVVKGVKLSVFRYSAIIFARQLLQLVDRDLVGFGIADGMAEIIAD